MARVKNRYGWMLAAGAALGLVGGALLPALLDGPAQALARGAFAPVCHQLPSRSFAAGGEPLAVCHRCFGIYAGLLAGVLAWPSLATRLRQGIGQWMGTLVIVAGTPAAFDWVLGVAGLWPNIALTQTATGALLGTALGLALARAAMQTAVAASTSATPAPTEPAR